MEARGQDVGSVGSPVKNEPFLGVPGFPTSSPPNFLYSAMKNSASSSSISSAGSTESALLRRSSRLAEKAQKAAAEKAEPSRVRISIAYPAPVRSGRNYGGYLDQLFGLLVILIMSAFGYVLIRDLSSLK